MKTIKQQLLQLAGILIILPVAFISLPSVALAATKACDNTDNSTKLQNCVTQSPLVKDIQMVINFLSAGVGIVVIGMIILGGIQYSIAGDNAQAVSAAKQRIINALTALLVYIFAFAFINWLIPGGLFG